jgi:natural product precursor
MVQKNKSKNKNIKIMKNLKLNKLSARNLTDRQMDKIKGGDPCVLVRTCTCGCQYANSGGSSVSDNCSTNSSSGLGVPRGVAVKATCREYLCW